MVISMPLNRAWMPLGGAKVLQKKCPLASYNEYTFTISPTKPPRDYQETLGETSAALYRAERSLIAPLPTARHPFKHALLRLRP